MVNNAFLVLKPFLNPCRITCWKIFKTWFIKLSVLCDTLLRSFLDFSILEWILVSAILSVFPLFCRYRWIILLVSKCVPLVFVVVSFSFIITIISSSSNSSLIYSSHLFLFYSLSIIILLLQLFLYLFFPAINFFVYYFIDYLYLVYK